MLEKITKKIKNEPLHIFLTIVAASLVLLFTTLFSFCVLQSDDYSYSGYLKDGLSGFLSLTANHFMKINGRAIVHFFLQITLALPGILVFLIKSSILFLIGYLSFKTSSDKKGNFPLYIIAFYSMIMLTGVGVLKEAVMWSSGFFNYVFPCLLALFALFLNQKGSFWQYLVCFMAGATTEQWGISAFVLITIYISLNLDKFSLKAFIPSFFTIAGYATIFLSPATVARANMVRPASFYGAFAGFPQTGETFFNKTSPIIIMLIFIVTLLITAFLKKKAYSLLYTGVLPLLLILTLPFHHFYTTTFVAFLVYLALSAAVFLKEKKTSACAYLCSSLMSILIILPANTFEARITFPGALLLILAIIFVVKEWKLSCKTSSLITLLLLVVSLTAFYPSYMGFYENHKLDKLNLEAIEKAKETNTLNYIIDYNKNYAMHQMFNGGWFFNSFVALYELDDCDIYLDSANSKTLYLNDKALTSKALVINDEIYVPMRKFAVESGGSILDKNGSHFTICGRTLTYLDGILSYADSTGAMKYLVADNYTPTNFYTLYVRIDVVEDAFNLNIKAL